MYKLLVNDSETINEDKSVMSKEVLESFPELYSTDHMPNNTVPIVVKFSIPSKLCAWYAVEYDHKTNTCFGFCNIGDDEMAELGYFSLDEIISYCTLLGVPLKQDRHFNATLHDVITFKSR